jgi:hypothetical protein
MNKKQELTVKCKGYLDQGHLVLTVTLSTYVESDHFARSDKMRHFWDSHFIYRVQRRLHPYREHLDHDYMLEKSPEGFWHYHGLLFVKAPCGPRLWQNDGLDSRLARDLKTFETAGTHRPFKVNDFLIEPIRNAEAWCKYITKMPDSQGS